MQLALAYVEMRVGCCQKQDLRDGGGFSGWVGLWMEVVVRIEIWGIFGFRTIERRWMGCESFRLSCQLRHFPSMPC